MLPDKQTTKFQTPCKNLSGKCISAGASSDLRTILRKHFGKEIDNFTDERINEIGLRLLNLTALVLRRQQMGELKKTSFYTHEITCKTI